MTRTQRVVGLVCIVACLTTAAACIQEDRLIYPDEVDLARLDRMQNDPWLAPDDVRLSSETAGGSAVGPFQRATVQRGYTTSLTPGGIATLEVGAAQRAGWQVTGATCRAARTDNQGGVVVSLRHDQGGPMTAWLQVGMLRGDPAHPVPHDAGPGVQMGSAAPSLEHPVWVQVTGIAQQHVDQWWPNQRVVAIEETCLSGASPGVAAQEAPGDTPIRHEGEKLPHPAARPWPSGMPPGLPEAMANTHADSLLTTLGVAIPPDSYRPPNSWEEDYSTRLFPQGESEQHPVPSTTLDDMVDQATDEGWTLTYAGCWSSGLTLAELRRPVGKDYSVVLRLTQVADVLEPGQATLNSHAQVTSPSWYGPAADSLDAVPQVCATPTDEAFVWEGTPWFGPSQLAPVQTGDR